MATETINKMLPWKAGVPAWVMAAQGAIIAGIGVFILTREETAVRAVLLALGALMLFNGVPRLMRYYNESASAPNQINMIQGWFGTVAGVVAILFTLIAEQDNLSLIAFLFGIALVVSGGLEIYDRYISNPGRRRLVLFVMPVVLIVAGVILLAIPLSSNITPQTFGQVLALLGFALLAIGLIRVYGNYQRRDALKEAEAKRAQLVKEIGEAEKRAGVKPEPATPAPVPAPVAAATGVPASAVTPVVAPPGDEPEDPAVKAALEP